MTSFVVPRTGLARLRSARPRKGGAFGHLWLQWLLSGGLAGHLSLEAELSAGSAPSPPWGGPRNYEGSPRTS